MCDSGDTSIQSNAIPRWNRYKIDKDGDYDSKGIWDRESVYRDSTRTSKWDKFRVDEKLYNDIS